MVVMYDADIVGWEQRAWEGWYGEGLEEVNMVLEWSSNKLGGFPWMLVVVFCDQKQISDTGGGYKGVTVAEPAVVILVNHVARVMQVSCDGRPVSKVTTRTAGQVIRVGAVVKGKVVM